MNEEITTEQELQQVNEEQISSPEKQSDSPEKKKKERSEKSAKRLVFMWGMLAGAAVTLLVCPYYLVSAISVPNGVFFQ